MSSSTLTGVVVLSAPQNMIAYYVGLVAQEWEPDVGAAMMRGSYVRCNLDARLSADAMAALSGAVLKSFPSKGSEIVK